MPSNSEISRRVALAEILLIFGLFALQGAWPAPDVNETHYLAKAIHYWNPDWVRGDLFVESPDTHKVFVFAFGWLSLFLSQDALIWTGRITIWLLLAWSWRRLSVAVVPRAWFSVLTAALFACLTDRCHMAGEWVIGGVEAKGFSYALVFLGLESLVRNRWNRGLLFFGAASAMHVLVGGWVAMAAGIAWIWLKIRKGPLEVSQSPATNGRANINPASKGPASISSATNGRGFMDETPSLKTLWPGIVGGLLLALPGLIPSLALDWGVDREIVRKAHEIYTFERLPHHLMLTGIRPFFIVRLALLWGFWLLLGRASRRSSLPDETKIVLCRLRAFVSGAVVIALIGAAFLPLAYLDRFLAGHLFRFYWFRTTDMALPLGVALESVAWIALSLRINVLSSPFGRGGVGEGRVSEDSPHPSPLPKGEGTSTVCKFWLSVAVLLAAIHLGDYAWERVNPSPPRSHRIGHYEDWCAACAWVATPGNVAADAQFLTPRLSQSFKWRTGHGDVAAWKDVPQDPQSIVEWWNRIQDIYMTRQPPPAPRWHKSLAEIGEEGLRRLGEKYGADYAIIETTKTPLNLNVVYKNDAFTIYRLK